MLFNSIEFLFFLPLVFILYWFICNKKLLLQNSLLLISGYVFYGWWDWRFLFLLFISTVIDFFFGALIEKSAKRKKLFLWLSIINNLGILGCFKYYDFFADSAHNILESFGLHFSPVLLNIVLPVGISFYTFHGMSYVFDIYRGKVKPTDNFINYAVFVCFFPLLVAGPIERANHLLPQIVKKRIFEYGQAVLGLRLILWGLFKKIVIADSLAPVVNEIFENTSSQSSTSLVLGATFFAFQIYGDFSGYTDIARGTARLFGIELLVNFRFPYFSRDIAEFWRRWHISLSSWFRDYLYIPIGGSKKGLLISIRNTFLIFIVSGFWHGANWTFLSWGFLHALFFLPLLIFRKNRIYTGPIATGTFLANVKEIAQILTTFLLVCFAWIFFRTASITEAFQYIGGFASHHLWSGNELHQITAYMPLLILFLFYIEWRSRNSQIETFFDSIKSRIVRYGFYIFIVFIILMYGTFEKTAFIYFQF